MGRRRHRRDRPAIRADRGAIPTRAGHDTQTTDRLDLILSPSNQASGARFGRCKNHLTRGRSGSGLGPAIASSLAEAMDGILTLGSTVGVGTAATVVLPVSGGIESDLTRDARPVAREGAEPASA